MSVSSKRHLLLCSLSMQALLLAACGADGPDAPPPGEPPVVIDPPVVVEPSDIRAASVTLAEGESVEVTVELSAAQEAQALVHVRSQGDTAGADDFAPVDVQLAFEPGELSKALVVTAQADEEYEKSETFALTFEAVTDNVRGRDALPITITDVKPEDDDDGDSKTCSSTMEDYDLYSQPQDCLPCEMGAEADPHPDHGFGSWIAHAQADLREELTKSGCETLHNRYWVLADDGRAYHTWHPAQAMNDETGEMCQFGHEHGDDPSTSNLFIGAGGVERDPADHPDMEGYPPFSYVAAQVSNHDSMHATPHRHEDHFGHKVFVVNDFRPAQSLTLELTRAADESTREWQNNCKDAGDSCTVVTATQDRERVQGADYTCNWYSKLHQGSTTTDSISNHLHEYFLTFACNDAAQTRFNVKQIKDWGDLNQLMVNNIKIANASDTIGSELLNPSDLQPDLVDPPMVTDRLNDFEGGNREFVGFSGVQYKNWGTNGYQEGVDQPMLWSGNSDAVLDTPAENGKVRFAPYYSIKNPAFWVSDPADPVARRTMDLCRSDNADGTSLTPGGYCAILADYEAFETASRDHWLSADSPFTGTIRALNFKQVEVDNTGPGAMDAYCTDRFGQITEMDRAMNTFRPDETTGACAEGYILQYVSMSKNDWAQTGITGSVNQEVVDWDANSRTWVKISQRAGANTSPGQELVGAGIGWEYISVGSPGGQGVRVPN